MDDFDVGVDEIIELEEDDDEEVVRKTEASLHRPVKHKWYKKPSFPLVPIFTKTNPLDGEGSYWHLKWMFLTLWSLRSFSIVLDLDINKYSAGFGFALLYWRFWFGIPYGALFYR